MSEDEQSPGGRSLRMGKKKKKKDGPNWFMIAGGAVVMAVSVAFGRKKILNEGEKAKERAPNAQAPSHEDDETGSVRTYETVHNGTPFWNKSESAVPLQAEFEFRSFKTKRPAPNDPSPQVSKFCRQLSQNSVCQSTKDPAQSDAHTSTALRAGLTARREMAHRLRQQIRSRDAMIYDMQTQLSDQEQMVAMHRNHSVDLQECVQAISSKLFEANLEVQRLHRELMAQRAKPIADLEEECIDIAVAEIKRQWVHPKDFEEIILEARKLNEEVKRLERQNEAKDNLAEAKSRQCELLSKRVSTLATELEEVKTAAHGKERLLELKEEENLKLANVLDDLQHKLEIETRDYECARSSKLSRRTDARNLKSSGKSNHKVDQSGTLINYEEVSPSYMGVVGGNYHQAGNLRKPHESVPPRINFQGSEDGVAEVESRCVSDAHTKRCEAPADQNDHEINGKINESLILKFENEVDEVASALALTSKVVLDEMQSACRILTVFQKHSDSRTDAQPQIGPQDFSQVFSCLSEGMSAEQRQELRHELEQVAKQQDIERAMKELAKHQTKLGELKSVVAKVTARFNAQSAEDDASNAEVLQVAASLSDIEQKLAVQEEIAKETSLINQQLLTSLQLSASHHPPIQEIWRTVKEASGYFTSVNGHQKQSVLSSSDENSRNALLTPDEVNSSRILERQDSSSASRPLSSNRIHTGRWSSSPTKLLERPYQFQLGAPDGPTSTSRTRRGGPLGAGKASFRKPATHHENMVGSKRQSNCVGEPSEHNSQRLPFRPDSELAGGFSFGLSAKDRPLDNVGTSRNYYSETLNLSGVQQLEAIVDEPYEQDDRMSSPEPESNTHMLNEQRFSAFVTSELPSNPTFSKRFRSNNTGSETSTATSNESMHFPAYDDSGSQAGRFGSPQSPCFGVTIDESTSRKPYLFRSDGKCSSPLAAASSNSRFDLDSTTDLRKLFFNCDRECHSADEVNLRIQIKRSTEENFSDSNPNCSPRLHDVNPSNTSARVGVSPFAARMASLDVRQPGSPVGSLRSFQTLSERDPHLTCQEDEEDEEDEVENENFVSQQNVYSRVRDAIEDRHTLFNKDLESLHHSVSNLDTEDSSESCIRDEPLAFLPSLLRRSYSSNH